MKLAYGGDMKSVISLSHASALALGLCLSPVFAQTDGGALEADEVTFDDASGEVKAIGNVELTAESSRLTTQKLWLDRDNALVTIPGALLLQEADGTKINASQAILNTDLNEGTLGDLSVALQPSGRMRAMSAEQSPDVLSLSDANFTSCAPCENPQDDPLWQIQAARITYDRKGQNVFYAHPRFEIFGTPIFYLPYMAHAGPEVDRRSGFLPPRLASSNDFGAAFETPYYLDLAPNYDLTLTPRISEKQDPFLTTQWRHLTRFGSYKLTSYAHSPLGELSEDTSRDNRFGLMGSGQFHFAQWNLSFKLEDASDDLFFRRYDITDANRLTNQIKLMRDWGNQSLTIEAHGFRNTVSSETASTVDIIAPRLTHQIYFDTEILGGGVSMTNSLTHDIRNLGLDITHMGSQIDWNREHTTRGGFVLSARNRLALDAYQYHPQDGQTVEAEEFLSANATALTIAYPLRRITTTDTQTITPRAQLVLATENEDYNNVPFIGGSSISLSRAQLFNPLATKDEASRFNLGVTHTLDFLSRLQTEFFIGQSVNLSDRNYTLNSGYGDDRSNLVTDISLRAGALSLLQQARFDETGSNLLRSETKAGLNMTKVQLGVSHSFYEAGQNGVDVLDEIAANIDWTINQNWSFDAMTRENRETGGRVEARANLNYEDECTLLTLSFDRDYSSVAGIEPNTSVKLSFTLKTIGGTP